MPDPNPRPRVVSELPREVVEVENVWIPMPDGVRLAARLWLPDGAEAAPVPAIVESIPYRKRDGTRRRDETIHRYFAGHGYACVRVDLRGSGDSDGILEDEYSEQEHSDGIEVLRWIAAQPWCNGAIGMMGKSWGGFSSLQIAALAPPELRAILVVCAADDRYEDDAHYMGGCLLTENVLWGAMLFTLSALPPDPLIVGERWRRMWTERLERLPLYAARWLSHPLRDEYWKHGSVCEDYEAVRCPVYAIGGWADGYTNSVPRLLAGLRVPCKGLVGPWAHVYPHEGVPGPAIGFLQEALRWWDRYLRGVDNGIDREPTYRAWMQQGVQPRTFHAFRPGRWVAEERWPTERTVQRRLYLTGSSTLSAESGRDLASRISSPQTVGLASGAWCGFGLEGDMPGDQRPDDEGSLVYDSEPLERPLEILGAPVIELEVAVDRPRAILAVRLNDLRPDGSSERVTYGLLDLTHRDGHERLAPIEVGRRMRVRIPLNHAAHAFAPGHRIRVAISTSYWPIAWPAPEAATLTVYAGTSLLLLPERPERREDAELRPFPPPEIAPPPLEVDIDPGGVLRQTSSDPRTGETVLRMELDTAHENEAALTLLEPIDLVQGHAIVETQRIRADDPLSACMEIEQRVILSRGEWSTRIVTRTRLTSDASSFRLEAELEADEGDTPVVRRRWEEVIPRLDTATSEVEPPRS